MDSITITIDGQKVTANPGDTVLHAAKNAGIKIPTLCAHDDLPDYGACRLCIVEIEGMRGFPTSCTTHAAEGMVVKTHTPEIDKLRSQIMELMMSGHPNACLVCNHREDCEKYRPKVTKGGRATRCGVCSNRDGCVVRGMVLECDTRYLDLPTLYCFQNLERDDPFMERDLNLCVYCGKCWRICEEIHGKPAITITKRGRWAKVGTAFDTSYVNSGCTFCGACIDICPTGTLTDRYARWHGRASMGWESACTLCPEGCAMKVMAKDNRITHTEMISFKRDHRLCAIGRFAFTQLVNSNKRLLMAMTREGRELVPNEWDETLAIVTEHLGKYANQGFVAIVDEANTRENRHMYERFTTDVMGGRCVTIPANGSVDDLDEGLKSDILAGKVKAAIVSGSLLDEEMFKKIEYLVIADCLPSDAIALADAVLPVTILAELEGTFRNSSGEVLSLGRTVPIRGEARPEWQILGDLAAALGHQELSFKTVDEITAKIADDPAPAKFAGAPRDTLADLPGRFRGHYIADYVPALEAMDLPSSPKPPVAPLTEGFRVLSKKEVVPNFFSLTIEAPAVATYAKPGQFIIVMVNEFSERVPFTLIDWDAEAGTITLIVEEVGRSSGEIAQVEEGGLLAHVTGPLGMPLTVAEGETVVLGGGCYGVGAIYPIAKALKQSGKHVICVIEASSSFLLYMEKEMREVCNELIIATKDGSRGLKGGVQEVFVNIVNRGTKVDQFIAIGCTFMMRMVTEATRPLGVPLQVALNPIMVDGTGMCGACRLAVGEETKFACVDGPFFDGHLVDWDELASRRSAYAREEIEAIPQTAGGGRMVTEPAPAGPGACAGTCGGGSHGRRSTVQHLTVSK